MRDEQVTHLRTPSAARAGATAAAVWPGSPRRLLRARRRPSPRRRAAGLGDLLRVPRRAGLGRRATGVLPPSPPPPHFFRRDTRALIPGPASATALPRRRVLGPQPARPKEGVRGAGQEGRHGVCRARRPPAPAGAPAPEGDVVRSRPGRGFPHGNTAAGPTPREASPGTPAALGVAPGALGAGRLRPLNDEGVAVVG